MVVTRRMAKENACRNNGSGSDASDNVAADQPSIAAVYRDAARDNVSKRAPSPRSLPIDNDDSQPQNHIENDTIPACSRAPVHRSRVAPHRRGRKTASSSKPHLAKQATTKAGGLNMPNEVNSNEDASQPPPVKRGEKRRREEAEEGDKENITISDPYLSPTSVRRIRRRAARTANDESETMPTNKMSLFAVEDSSNRNFPQCISSCDQHPETDTIAAYALVELSSGKLIQEDEIKDVIYRLASGGKLKAVHPAPTVIA
ncbi:hypothetical protein A7U60_g2550 [Sanghuangporus baumii]|uniref:Uncharacterized protein n=1 Tax=Sanghuangporus baumii TaxID=108892 RepID=A0A9Q5I2I0_SANBA|nr:hypothetical protein A7U60_g2550 [Sanghuangporus baumii]